MHTARGGGQPLGRREARADAVVEAEALQAGDGKDNGVVVTGVELGEARVHVAAQVAHFEIRSPCFQLGMTAQRRGADDGAVWQRIEFGVVIADKGIGGVLAFEDRGKRETGLQFDRHVLERMHGDIRFATLKCQLQFLEKQTLAADRRQRAVEHFVAARGQRHQFDDQRRIEFTKARGNVFGLPKGELAFAGGDAQEHGDAAG
jgi:hypothetical protein